MKINALILSGAALIVLNVAPVFAQQTDTSSTPSNPPTINQRKENQQDRIANGVQSGQLTAGETAHLEGEEAGLNKEESGMRAEDNGHLTSADRSLINKQQNGLSNQIYQDKHNANTAHYGTNEIGARRENQQDRIAQGIRSGQLTAGETSRLEHQESSINRQDARMRAADGGKLTNGDKKVLNQRLNNTSKNIYRDEHNGRTQK
ncbi:MAG TPA: hypothetical protein VEF07_11610 [Candidatus Binataceae bacterium]|nr:hypothetical protein [Candidatus Binataceae bacterium]